MPRPLRGLVAIAEYGSKFEADAAVALLHQAGIDATPSYDPALNSVATYFASDRTVEVLVREADAEAALARLEHAGTDLPPEFTEEWEPRASTGRRAARAAVMGYLLLTLLLVVGVLVLGTVF